MEHNILAVIAAEARDIGRVDGNSVLKGAAQFPALNRNIFLCAVDIAERKSDELNILFLDILHDF